MHAAPIVDRAKLQTTVRPLLLNAGVAAAAIAMAGSQNKRKASQGLERMSQDLHVVVLNSMELTLYIPPAKPSDGGSVCRSGISCFMPCMSLLVWSSFSLCCQRFSVRSRKSSKEKT